MLGAFEGRVQVVDTLLRLGADPNVRSRSNGTAIVASMIKTTPSNEVSTKENVSVIKIRYHNLKLIVRKIQYEKCSLFYESSCTECLFSSFNVVHFINTHYLLLLQINNMNWAIQVSSNSKYHNSGGGFSHSKCNKSE